MRQSIDIGKTRIDYDVLFGTMTKRKSIHVTPSSIKVKAPVSDDIAKVNAWVHLKRRWLFDAFLEMKAVRIDVPQRMVSGSTVRYRGRNLRMRIYNTQGVARLEYRTRFDVFIPSDIVGEARSIVARGLIEGWMKRRCSEDISRVLKERFVLEGIQIPRWRLAEFKTKWVSVRKDGTLVFDWRLIQERRSYFSDLLACI